MKALDYWIGELANRSESTRKKYRRYLDLFCQWIGKDADELVIQRKKDLEAKDLKDQRRMETALKTFVAHLKNEEMSISTQQVAYAAVRSFFEMHYMPLRMRRGDYPSGESLGYRAATKNDILKLLEDASLRVRAMILFLKDSGLRVSDVVSLTYKDVAKGLEGNAEFINLNLVTKKNNVSARTFLGPEAIEALKEYLQQRRKGTRRLPPEEVQHDSPLFRTRSREVTPISRSGMSSLITYHTNRAKLNGELSAHSFRKFFQTQLEAAGVHPNWVEQMMGHKLTGVRNSYSRPNDQQLRETYTNAYQFLRAFPIPATAEEMRRQAEELKKANREVQQLRSKMQELEENAERSQEMFKRVMSAVYGSQAELRLEEVERKGKKGFKLTLGLPKKDIERLRKRARKYGEEKKTETGLPYTDVVKVDKQNIDAIVELLKQGYKMAFENEKYAIFTAR